MSERESWANIAGDPMSPGDDPMKYRSEHGLLVEQARGVMLSLTRREIRVLQLRFGLDGGDERTQAQVGKEIGRSRSTAGRIERRALAKLKAPSRPNL